MSVERAAQSTDFTHMSMGAPGGPVISPPLVAVTIALFIGLIPQVQALFFGPGAPLGLTVTAALSSLGACTVPCILLTLGAQVRWVSGYRAQQQ